MPLALLMLISLSIGCGTKTEAADTAGDTTDDTGEWLGNCDQGESEVECCNEATSTIETCCCYEEECEEVMELERTADGGCEPIIFN